MLQQYFLFKKLGELQDYSTLNLSSRHKFCPYRLIAVKADLAIILFDLITGQLCPAISKKR